MRHPPSVSPRLHFPLYSRRPNRDRSGQFLSRHRPPRYVLRSSPLPLCLINRSCVRYRRRLCTLIPPVLRLHPTQHLNKNSLCRHVRGGKFNLLPPTLPRTSRNAPTLLRLPRRLYPLKYSLLNWVTNLFNRSHHILIYPLRSIRS